MRLKRILIGAAVVTGAVVVAKRMANHTPPVDLTQPTDQPNEHTAASTVDPAASRQGK